MFKLSKLKNQDKIFCFSFWGIFIALCLSCTGKLRNDENFTSSSDSIKILIQKGISLSDSTSEKTIEYLEKALHLSMQVNPEKDVFFDIFYNLGVQYEKTGNYELADSHFKEALKYSDKKKLVKTGNVYNYLGQLAILQGKNDFALDYFSEALKIRNQLNDIEGQASSYLNIGTAYQKAGDYEKAQEHYNHSLDLYSELSNEMGMADCYNNMGGLNLEQSKPLHALDFFFKSEKIYLDNDIQDNLWNVYFNIGFSYYYMFEVNLTLEYCSKMLHLAQLLSSPAKLADTYHIIGSFYDDIQQKDSAFYYYGKTIEIADSARLNEVLYYALKQRSDLYASMKLYYEAYTDHEKYSSTKDSVINFNTEKAFTQKSTQYQLDKQQFEFDKLQQEQIFQNQKLRIFIITLFVVVFLVGVVVVVEYRAFVNKKKANLLLADQNDLLKKQKQEITDSILYASLIQKAILPSKEYVDSVLPEHFIYYKPRDIVSGDFYWIDSKDDYIIVVAADCTGHGVPGAIVSMLGISALSKIVGRTNVPKANVILNELRDEIINLLNPAGSADKRQDGMDIALAIINTKINTIEFAGAFNSLYLIHEGQLTEIRADRMPIGLYGKLENIFTSKILKYSSGDSIYMFSDGYSDQFGGSDDSKFKNKNLKNLLIRISGKTMEEQERIIDETHLNWKGSNYQVDDILIVGIKLR